MDEFIRIKDMFAKYRALTPKEMEWLIKKVEEQQKEIERLNDVVGWCENWKGE